VTSPPLIFDIKRGALDDGPGIRSTVFFKGCPLACVWCHNPEALSAAPQLSYREERCLGHACRACRERCPAESRVDRACHPGKSACRNCGACAESCPTLARELLGRRYHLDELCSLLLRDLPFYRASGGGVTLSGGEPTLHHDYLRALLTRLKEGGVHTAIQTCGAFDAGRFVADLLPLLDLVYFDLKIADSALHRRYTGVGNDVITENFAVIAAAAPERLVARVPLVPGITATEKNLTALARLVKDLGVGKWELLPYNPGAVVKLKRLGVALRDALPEEFMTAETELAWRALFDSVAGGSRPRLQYHR
jgi:pyruvate formate lyase activating enzyme